jgi:hypothetical protein
MTDSFNGSNLLVWPDSAPDWNYVDRATDAASEEQAAQIFGKVVEMDAENSADSASLLMYSNSLLPG